MSFLALAAFFACSGSSPKDDTAADTDVDSADTDTDSDTDSDTDTDTDTDTDSDTDTDTGGDTSADVEPCALTQTVVDEVAFRPAWSSGTLTGTVTESTAEFTVAYSEEDDAGAPICSATVQVSSIGTSPACDGCVWGHELAGTVLDEEGECYFGSPAVGFITDGSAWIAWYEDHTDAFGDHVDEALLIHGERASGSGLDWYPYHVGGSGTWTDGYDPATGALDVTVDRMDGYNAGLLYDWCTSTNETGSRDVSGVANGAGTLTCAADSYGDGWTFTGAAGDHVYASVDSPSRGATLMVALVGPDGCAETYSGYGRRCSGGGSCADAELVLPTDGEWQVFVIDLGCSGATVEYTLGVAKG